LLFVNAMTRRPILLIVSAAALAGCMNQCDQRSSNAQEQAAPTRPELRPIDRLEKQPKSEMLHLRRQGDAASPDGS